MNYPRVILAATASGTGKTTITCGLLGALKEKGRVPCSFKCGPDYIDPMFHRNVLGVPAGNLDTFFTDDETTVKLFTEGFSGDIAVIEGVMGLYDGIGGTGLTGSTYDLARALKAPIILVINGRGMGRSILAQIKGFLDYDTENLIKGVILNKVSKSFGQTLKELIEKELSIKVVGIVENRGDIAIESRHLGLLMPEEISDIKLKLEIFKDMALEGIDIETLINIAGTAEDLFNTRSAATPAGRDKLRLAVARDEAFCFYYKENLKLLEESGVELVEFSPIHDQALPENINGILLGGGYPENYLETLAANSSMKLSIKKHFAHGIPTLAECGGFMYLMDRIVDKNGNEYDMVGCLNGSATYTGKLVRFGYITLKDDENLEIKGHEFHYFDTDNNGEDLVATKPATKASYSCGYKLGNSYLGFPHLYYPSSPKFVENFVEAMKNYGRH